MDHRTKHLEIYGGTLLYFYFKKKKKLYVFEFFKTYLIWLLITIQILPLFCCFVFKLNCWPHLMYLSPQHFKLISSFFENYCGKCQRHSKITLPGPRPGTGTVQSKSGSGIFFNQKSKSIFLLPRTTSFNNPIIFMLIKTILQN